ncbi:TPA: hypothetical protein F6T95_06630 [Proteus mirabilis]|uniref:hypothetical protein n=1 Tax=Proteus mirabilis TaxID=584 RepID=UPI001A33D4BB|nr:hypothetical protein [Proteus mirabilis]HAU4278712.1 hypothetical protein [Proteus mirabilis]
MSKIVISVLMIAVLNLLSINTVSAQNYPCSGKKGGVSHCENGKFICNDGSTSKSKRVCTDESDTKKK